MVKMDAATARENADGFCKWFDEVHTELVDTIGWRHDFARRELSHIVTLAAECFDLDADELYRDAVTRGWLFDLDMIGNIVDGGADDEQR